MLLFHIVQALGYFQHHWYYCSLWRMGTSFVKPSGPSTCFWGYVSSLLKFFHPGDLLYISSLWFSRVLFVKENRHGAFSSDHEYTVLWYKVGCFFFIYVCRSLAIISSYCTQMSIKVDGALCYMWSGILSWNSIHLCDLCFHTSVAASSILLFYPYFHLLINVPLSFTYSLIKVCKVVFHNID